MDFLQPSTSNGGGGLFDELDEDIRRLQKKAKEASALRTGSMSSRGSFRSNLTDEPCKQIELKPGAPAAQFQRLRDYCMAIQGSAERIDANRKELDPEGELSANYERFFLASELQNQEITVERLRKQVEEMKRRIAKRRLMLSGVIEEQTAHDVEVQQIEFQVERLDEKVAEGESEAAKIRKHRDVLTKLIVRRRREMIDELFRAYHIKLNTDRGVDRYGKPTCSCVRRDLIAGVHLPHGNSLLGHMETELAASLGHVVNLVRCLSWILDMPLPFPVKFKGSMSWIFDPRKEKRFSLFGIRTKLERAQLDMAVQLLNANIEQLRTHCGFESPLPDRTLLMLHELHQWFNNDSLSLHAATSVQLNRPFDSVLSPAAIVGQRTSEPAEPVRQEANRLLHTLDVSRLVLEDLDSVPRSRTLTFGVDACSGSEDLSDLSAHSANTFQACHPPNQNGVGL